MFDESDNSGFDHSILDWEGFQTLLTGYLLVTIP